MELYLNKNLNLCISTLIFMMFDLYVVNYSDVKSGSFLNNLFTELTNKTLNIGSFYKDNDVVIYTKVIPDIKSKMTISSYNVSFKLINTIKINSNDVYKLNVSNDTKTMVAFLVKKFDDLNYMMPVMVSFSEEYLNNANRKVNLDNFYEFLNNRKQITDIITKFNIVNS